MHNSLKAALICTLALVTWLGWCLKGPDAIAVTAAQALPPDFIWGVSSSAYQSEGGALDSNWSRWNDSHPEQDRYGNSVDFRHRYREDVALARQLGVSTFRVGINWARVEPEKGQIDQAELAFYDDLILALKQAGIKPLITLEHFVRPGWVSDQGGWTNPQTTTDFVAYTSLIAKRYHADVHLWITLNEVAAFMLGEMVNEKMSLRDSLRMRENLVSAHRQAYDVIHAIDPGAVVTSNIVWAGDRPGSWLFRTLTDWMFLDAVEDKCDVIAVDYYFSDILRTLKADGKYWTTDPDPAGLYRALKMLKARYPDKPILIAEIGMATEDGKPRGDGVKREEVLRDSVYWTQRARADGVNVVGFMVWSLTDNFEWGSYTPRFGLYSVNVGTDPSLKRVPTAAVPAYQEVIRAGGVGSAYRPVMEQH